jgi:hypothetical protein
MTGPASESGPTPGNYGGNGAIRIPQRKAQRIARIFRIPDANALHHCLQAWADIYSDNNERYKPPNLKERDREAVKVLAAIRNATTHLRNRESAMANAIAVRMRGELQMKALSVELGTDEPCAISLSYEDFLETLVDVSSELEGRLYGERSKRPGGMPQNRGLAINLRNIERYWIESSAAPGSETYKAYWHNRKDAPGNPATQFTCLCLRVIDPRLSNTSIFSQMKKYVPGKSTIEHGS